MAHKPLPSKPTPDAGMHQLRRHQGTQHMAAACGVEAGRAPSDRQRGNGVCSVSLGDFDYSRHSRRHGLPLSDTEAVARPYYVCQPSQTHCIPATIRIPLSTLHDAGSITQHPRGADTSLHSVRPTEPCHVPIPPNPAQVPNTFTHFPHGMLRLFPPPFPLTLFFKISQGPRVSSLIPSQRDQPSTPSRGISATD
ncbi:hypothetical protein CGRA01v4_14766 [Colletotrichum graminicola]|nr:hypothetical protein CGRA01v4_14766 [Colletotrichum graminicola]